MPYTVPPIKSLDDAWRVIEELTKLVNSLEQLIKELQAQVFPPTPPGP